MVVRAIQPALGEPSEQPVEDRFVTDVHAERDLRLLAVAAEGALSDQQPDHDSLLEIRQLSHRRCSTPLAVSPSRKT